LPEDPRLLHLRALVMSNLAGLMAADGWVEEAQVGGAGASAGWP
jgi:hypothetical protein